MRKLILIVILFLCGCYFQPINFDDGRSGVELIPANLPSAAVDQFYSVSVHARGGYPPYDFKIIGGVFPPGLTCSLNGIISGYPIDDGRYEFCVMVSDSGGLYGGENHDGQMYTIVVSGSIPLTILTTHLPDGFVGRTYDATIDFIGGTPPYSCCPTTPLPAGLFIYYPGNHIYGVPQTAGNYTITFVVEDWMTATDIMTYSFTIYP